jgi:hypothetical protein
MKAQYEVLGWRSEKATRPGWDDRRPLTFAKAHAGDQEPDVSIVPGGTDISFCTFPSTSYWATFIGSLRDDCSGRISLPLMLAQPCGRGAGLTFCNAIGPVRDDRPFLSSLAFPRH